jgi:uncharacterized protein (DUF4415 family)
MTLVAMRHGLFPSLQAFSACALQALVQRLAGGQLFGLVRTASDFASLHPVSICYRSGMTRRPRYDARTAAEKAFKAVTTKPVEAPPKPPPSLPGGKETVSLRIDRDVLDFFQEDGAGWQDRINAALRKAAGK